VTSFASTLFAILHQYHKHFLLCSPNQFDPAHFEKLGGSIKLFAAPTTQKFYRFWSRVEICVYCLEIIVTIMIIVTMTIKRRPFGIGSWMDCIRRVLCVCVYVCALCPSFYVYTPLRSKPRRLAGWPGLVTFVLRLLLQCVAGVRERRRKRSGCSCYGMRRTIGKERERRRE
jgi:hypothetical protein